VEELASAVSNVVEPLAFVSRSVRPYLDTISMALAILDLPFIYSTVWEHNFILELKTLFL
jgi:hypothetical protein